MGYSLETAVADLVDNSIAAGANTIEIKWDWNAGDPAALIIDDGRGMDENHLIAAMRFGGTGPDEVRGEDDLGRFGLGLKTASLSQCRQLRVSSKCPSGTASFMWDIDHIREAGGEWALLDTADDSHAQATAILAKRPAGTVVTWRKVDFGRHEDRPDHAAFLRGLENLDLHLGMVFHRFIAGDARRIAISLNDRPVTAWDPFLESHEATARSPEQPLKGPGGRVRVRGFVLPHRDRFRNDAEFEKAGGPEGWTAQQGFYVYRQKRLLSWGGWLGLGGSRAWTREEPSRLARLRVDIPNSADREWRIDIRKAIARAPDGLRKPLQTLAEDMRRKAREVFVHRGQYGARPKSAEVSRIWQVKPPPASRRYTIRRDHDLVVLLKEKLPASARDLLTGLLDHIERTVPVDRVWLDVTEQGVPAPQTKSDELAEAAFVMAGIIEKAGMPFADAAARVSLMDPFDQVPDLTKLLLARRAKRK